ncbi:MAG: signal peptidase [Nitrospira sp. ST-bin4]|uniref:signal peptide peptidase SppA n=1 Tax=Nitrospira cf. moscoviensis SBR1015 TaxID=96242 RepID=UPI000A0C8204|nr:signal peptide peptidase SppA [Nitrospira cf. moscoviensis SBR1015]MBY0247338.1 signal peptide peptidase SppA [Nitrospiraceae bacterium]OQW63530.1 MAG: signal peptidase [Nitrospira sp. ST-bin4]
MIRPICSRNSSVLWRPTMRNRFLALLFVGLSVSGCTFNFTLLPGQGPLQEMQVGGTGAAKVLLIEVSGMISSQEKDGLIPAPSLLARIKEQLARATQDDQVKAVVLRINSPGGTVTASDIIHHELKAFKASKKIPIIASIMDLGTSGGYYIAAAADTVLAHPSSVTGSIGVIMLTINARGLLEKVGVEATAVTSGPRKDMGSPFRVMTPEERAIFQGLIDSFYQRFLTIVQEGRPQLQMEQIKKLADGRIYTGDQAKAVGLVDDLGYLEDAIELAKKKAKLPEARVVTYQRPGEYSNNIYSKLLVPGPLAGFADLDIMALARGGTPQFMYLWMP